MDYFSLQQKVALARSLITKTSPAYVQFYITARCNLACEQCNIIYADANAQEMTIDQIRLMAENLAAIGVCVILLIGGEPFVRKDLPEIVKAFTECGIHVRMQTNGLATRQALEECVRNGAHDISISLDSLRPELQDTINGGFRKSWERAINSVSVINDIFPENGTAFFNNVLMPRNLHDIQDVIRFATAIGWGVSVVPVHVSTPDKPRGFQTFDDEAVVTFPKERYAEVKKAVEHLKALRRSGLNLYDSDEYLDDVYRFVAKEPLQWRRRNNNVCDSPNLYFAIAPNGNLKVCCDYEPNGRYPVYDPEFPNWYRDGRIHEDAYSFTRSCSGCMYGSYPEITISARYMKAMIERFHYFNVRPPVLQKYDAQQLREIAAQILWDRTGEHLDPAVLPERLIKRAS
jgi:MoaA/NifB/PqqE/SkfB family radical SAM enzyme